MIASAFEDVRLARIVTRLPLSTTALALVALLIGLVLRIAGVLAVTATALTTRLANTINANTDAPLLALTFAGLVAVLRLVSLALIAAIRATDTATAAVLAEAQEGNA